MRAAQRSAGLRGTLPAAGFVLDVGLLGEAEARRRVLAAWTPGATLRELPDGRWLLTLAAPRSVRAERAPGLVVTERGGVLTAGGAAAGGAPPGRLVECRHGERRSLDLRALPAIDPAGWLAIGSRTRVALTPLDAAPAATAVAPLDAVAAPDLRDLAEVRPGSGKLRRRLEEAERAARAGPAAAGGAPGPGFPPRGDRLVRLLLRTPVAGMTGRRHARYLRELTRSFERRDYDNALRDAIGIGGGGHGSWLTLRLPSRRQGALTPTARERPGGTVPWDGTAAEHLRRLYAAAAEQLERDGQIERAAFVHADLLDAPRDAIALLERHGRLELAARLAEGRELDADLVVRLWWQAGDRDRAVDLARARGAWAGAVALLQAVAPASALAMRAAWVAAEQQAGNHLAAIEAAWPEDVLREHVGDDLALLRTAGGPTAARALALQLAWRDDERWTADALGLLAGRDGAQAAQRHAFASAFSERPAAGDATDRRVAGQALRVLLRDGSTSAAVPGKAGRAIYNRLRERSDALLRADAPPYEPAPPALSVPLLHAGAEPGSLAVFDAVALPAGVLVAAGERGLVLLTRDGRVRARWAVLAHRLIVADHGAAVLVAGRGEALHEVHRLDLATRRLRRWASIASPALPDSFDGGLLTVVDRAGIAGLDTLGERPRELWRELDADSIVLDCSRSPGRLSGIVDVPLQGSRSARSIERWTWELPARRLARRELFRDDWPAPATRITADGTLLWLDLDEDDPREERRTIDGERVWQLAPPDGDLLVSGEHSGLVVPDAGEVRLTLRSPPRQEAVAVIAWAGATSPAFHVHDGVATAWVPDGRIVVVDLATRTALAVLRVPA